MIAIVELILNKDIIWLLLIILKTNGINHSIFSSDPDTMFNLS